MSVLEKFCLPLKMNMFQNGIKTATEESSFNFASQLGLIHINPRSVGVVGLQKQTKLVPFLEEILVEDFERRKILDQSCYMQGYEAYKATTCKKLILRRFITANIIEATTLHTDCWRGYRNISEHGYIHTYIALLIIIKHIKHKVNFVDLNDRSVHM